MVCRYKLLLLTHKNAFSILPPQKQGSYQFSYQFVDNEGSYVAEN